MRSTTFFKANTHFWKPIAIIWVIILLANCTTLSISYGMTDDYVQAYAYSSGKGMMVSYLRRMFFSVGRPIDGALKEALFSHVYFIRDFVWIRLVGLVGLLFLVIILFWVLSKILTLSPLEISLLVLLLVFIPSLSLYVAWTQYFDAPYGLVMSSLAAYLGKTVLKSNIPRMKKIIGCMASLLLLLGASFIHQSVAMYYWVIVACDLFLENGIISKQKLIHFFAYGINWFISMSVSFAFLKLWAALEPDATSRGVLVSDVVGKAKWFFSTVIVRSLNFNFLTQSKSLAFALIIIIVLGLWLNFQKGVIAKLVGMAIFVVLVLLSYFPNLVIAESWASYRTQVAITSMFILFIYIALKSLVNRLAPDRQNLIFHLVLCVWVIISISSYTYHQIRDITLPQSIEIRFITFHLQALKENHFDKIAVIRPSFMDSLSKVYGDEFGLPSTYPAWATESVIRMALREIYPGKGNNKQQYSITVLDPRTIVNPEEGVLLIDMADIRYLNLR